MAYLLSLFAAIAVQKNTRDSVGVEPVVPDESRIK